MNRLLITLAIIFISLSAGYALRLWVKSGHSSFSEDWINKRRIVMQKIAMFGLIPASAMLSLWGLPAPAPQLLVLPALGLAAWSSGGILAIIAASLLALDRRQTGSMFCCGAFTNIGAVGCLVCVMQFGEQAIAFASLYRLCEEFFYFAVAYPVARWFSLPLSSSPSLSLKNFHMEPVLKIVLLALTTGLVLNLTGVSRPNLMGFFASGFMITGTICFLVSIGLGLRLSKISCYYRQSACISLIKFLIVPVIVTSLAFLAGLNAIDGGMPLKIVAILSAMPVAMNALIPPSLFDLDLDLANSCWIFTTLALVPILPVLHAILPLL